MVHDDDAVALPAHHVTVVSALAMEAVAHEGDVIVLLLEAGANLVEHLGEELVGHTVLEDDAYVVALVRLERASCRVGIVAEPARGGANHLCLLLADARQMVKRLRYRCAREAALFCDCLERDRCHDSPFHN